MKPTGGTVCCRAVLLYAGCVCGAARGISGEQLQAVRTKIVCDVAPSSSAQKQAAPLLQVQIVAAHSGARRLIVFNYPKPHLKIVIRNVSRRAVQVFRENNSWGHSNVHLEVSAVNGRRLKKPLFVARGSRPWRANAPTTQRLAPGQSVVRDLWLHLPATVQFPHRKPAIAELNRDLHPQGDEYWFFPFPLRSRSATITMRAVYEVEPDGASKSVQAWTGRVASTPNDYQIHWNPRRR